MSILAAIKRGSTRTWDYLALRALSIASRRPDSWCPLLSSQVCEVPPVRLKNPHSEKINRESAPFLNTDVGGSGGMRQAEFAQNSTVELTHHNLDVFFFHVLQNTPILLQETTATTGTFSMRTLLQEARCVDDLVVVV